MWVINLFKDGLMERVILEAKYFCANKSTIREVALIFNVSKTTVHNDLTIRLREIDKSIYNDVRILLEYNKTIRHIRGGESTRIKYSNKKKTIY